MVYKEKTMLKKKILVIAVHPDDETLGCGGTLLRHLKNNDEINWVICTETPSKDDFYQTRLKEISLVSKKYNFNKVIHLHLKSMHVDEYTMSELIEKFSKAINEIKPDIIYLPFKGDVHSDHRTVFNAAFSCTKSFRYPFIKKIYMMETLSETEFSPSMKEDSFIPNVFVDISEYMDKKIEIMNIFKSEVQKHPFPRSEENILALGTFRGATAGVKYAESFMLVKEII